MKTLFPVEKSRINDINGQYIGNIVHLLIIDGDVPEMFSVIELRKDSWIQKRYAVVPSDAIKRPDFYKSHGRSANTSDGSELCGYYQLSEETLFNVATDDDLSEIKARPDSWFTGLLMYFKQWEAAMPIAGDFSPVCPKSDYQHYSEKFRSTMDSFFDNEIKDSFERIFSTGPAKEKQRVSH